MGKTNDYRRLHGVSILSVTKADANGWVGLITESHNEIRCKAELAKRFKLRKGYKGPITVGSYGQYTVVAYDPTAHIDVESHWIIENPELFDLDSYGFIYCITQKSTGKRYIGRRFWHSGNWKSYTSSSKYVNEAIQEYGMDDFIFTIWYTVKERGDLVYMEVKEQYDHNVLTEKLPNGERAWFNRAIGAIKFVPKQEHTDAFKAWCTDRNYERYKSEEARRVTGEAMKKHFEENGHHLSREISVDGIIYSSMREAERETGITQSSLCYAIKHGNGIYKKEIEVKWV